MSHLTSEQRYTISVLLEQNLKSEIAIVIKKKSVLTRELNVIVIYSGKYDFDLAQRKYENDKSQN
jgi:IS30 family transposase